MTQETNKESTFQDDSPVFKNWKSWYLLVIVVNILIISTIYLLFKAI